MFFHVALHLESSQDIGVMAGEWNQAQMAMLAEFGRGLSPAAMRHQAQLVLQCRRVSQCVAVCRSVVIAWLHCILFDCFQGFLQEKFKTSNRNWVTETYLSVT